jgi:hypothetical protein
MSEGVRFIRVHGRVVPIRNKKPSVGRRVAAAGAGAVTIVGAATVAPAVGQKLGHKAAQFINRIDLRQTAQFSNKYHATQGQRIGSAVNLMRRAAKRVGMGKFIGSNVGSVVGFVGGIVAASHVMRKILRSGNRNR